MTHGGPPKKGEIDFSFLGIGILHVDQEKKLRRADDQKSTTLQSTTLIAGSQASSKPIPSNARE
jgi:hypothetical protein